MSKKMNAPHIVGRSQDEWRKARKEEQTNKQTTKTTHTHKYSPQHVPAVQLKKYDYSVDLS